MQDDVVDHIAPVFGVVEAEGAAQVFRQVLRCSAVVVTGLHVHVEGNPERDTHRIKDCPDKVSSHFLCTDEVLSYL